MKKILRDIKNKIYDIPSWKTNRKIVVFESDDWGTVRMSSKQNYDKLLNAGVRVDKDAYCRYDALESEEDLVMLFEVLSSHKDKNNNPCIFTANTLVANPDFEKIKADNFNNYHFEPVTETFKKYPKHTSCFTLWQEGRDKNVFYNQFHGREHLNVDRWLHYLQSGSEETLMAFNMGMFGISTTITNENRKSFMAAFDADSGSQIEKQKLIITEGLDMFKALFKYSSESFIAPNYIYSDILEEDLHKAGVKYLQGGRVQKMPDPAGKGSTKKTHYLGQENKFGQTYLVRNVLFEPSFDNTKDWVNQSLLEIEKSFKNKKPAIISSHRLNYIGYIDQSNRDNNLKLLNTLLSRITSKWPDVEFMTSNQLGDTIQK